MASKSLKIRGLIALSSYREKNVKCIIVSPCSWRVRTKLRQWSLEPWPNTTWRVSRLPTTSWCRSSLRREVQHLKLVYLVCLTHFEISYLFRLVMVECQHHIPKLFFLFLQSWLSLTTPTCFTPWARLRTLTSCCVYVVQRGGRFSCAVVVAPHYRAHSNDPVCPSGLARSHCDLTFFWTRTGYIKRL